MGKHHALFFLLLLENTCAGDGSKPCKLFLSLFLQHQQQHGTCTVGFDCVQLVASLVLIFTNYLTISSLAPQLFDYYLDIYQVGNTLAYLVID